MIPSAGQTYLPCAAAVRLRQGYHTGTTLGPLNTADPYAFCFLEDALIATPKGEVPVEFLRIGDEVLTAEGRAVAVKWLGEQRIANTMVTSHSKARVCISKGALGGGLPHTGLYISTDHGMILDGLVVNASALVNGSTIRFVPMAEMAHELTYYRVETEAHEAILANGAASETFIDAAGRQDFDNYQEYLDLYGAERIVPEMPQPRIASRRHLPTYLLERLGATTQEAGDTVDWGGLLADPATKLVARRDVA